MSVLNNHVGYYSNKKYKKHTCVLFILGRCPKAFTIYTQFFQQTLGAVWHNYSGEGESKQMYSSKDIFFLSPRPFLGIVFPISLQLHSTMLN